MDTPKRKIQIRSILNSKKAWKQWKQSTMLMRGIASHFIGKLVRVTCGITLNLAYPIEWNKKLNRPRSLPPSHFKLKLYKVILILSNFIALLVFTRLCFMKPSQDQVQRFETMGIALAAVLQIFILPVTWKIFGKDASFLVDMYRATWKTERMLTGMLATPEFDWYTNKVKTQFIQPILSIVSFITIYIVPLGTLMFAFSHINPFYNMIYWYLNFEFLKQEFPAKVMRYLVVGPVCMFAIPIYVWYTLLFAFLLGYGIFTCWLWNLYILPDERTGKLKAGMDIGKAVRMYQTVRLLGMAYTKMGEDLVSPCLHHVLLLIVCVACSCTCIAELGEANTSTLFTVGPAVVVVVCSVLEYAVVKGTASGCEASKEFVRRAKMHYNKRSPYYRRVLRALLPTCVNLELVSSVETIKEGIKIEYFLNFVDRIAGFTVDIVLTSQ